LTDPLRRNIIASIRGSERWAAGFKSERWPASDRNRWPASYWNWWPASSESASQVERRGDSVGETCIHKLLVLFGDAQITLCNPKKVLRSAQLHVALRQFGDRRERDAMAVLHGSYGDSALFHSLDDEKINVVQIKCTVTVTLEQVCNFGGGLRPDETAWNR